MASIIYCMEMYGRANMEKCNGNFVSYFQIKTNIVDEIMLRDLCVECKFVISFWATHELILDIYIMSCFFLSVNERTHFFNPLLTLHMPNIIGHG